MGLGGIALALYFTASFSLSSPMSQTSTQLQIAHSSTDRSETPSSNDASDRTSQRTFTDTSTVWGPGTLSGRALLALGEVTIRGIDNLVIRGRILALRQRVGRKLTGNMCNDLMELCRRGSVILAQDCGLTRDVRPTMYSARITKEAIRLTLTQLCGGPKSAVYMFAFSLCKWPRQEARLILLQLIHSFFEITWPLEWEPQRWYDILITIIQVKEGWKNLIVEAAALLLGNPAFPSIAMHPIHFICAEATAGLPESSLSILQYAYSPYMRAEAWIELQKCGLRLSERMSKIEKLVQETSTFASPQIMDALTDLTIFLGWDTELQPSALTCLKNVTQAQWQSLYRALGRQQARAERSLSR
ncbi:hypothetical protein C8R46DRAFT_652246 [Mycena filopes]|nr:hypothetical protein C8R46DRAFT_652246 [Mycena filopes]